MFDLEEEFDDLDRLLDEDRIPYNEPAAARRGRGEGGGEGRGDDVHDGRRRDGGIVRDEGEE